MLCQTKVLYFGDVIPYFGFRMLIGWLRKNKGLALGVLRLCKSMTPYRTQQPRFRCPFRRPEPFSPRQSPWAIGQGCLSVIVTTGCASGLALNKISKLILQRLLGLETHRAAHFRFRHSEDNILVDTG